MWKCITIFHCRNRLRLLRPAEEPYQGNASLDYHEDGEQSADLVKVDIPFKARKSMRSSAIVHQNKAYALPLLIMTKKRA